jgi:hypothetical protein
VSRLIAFDAPFDDSTGDDHHDSVPVDGLADGVEYLVSRKFEPGSGTVLSSETAGSEVLNFSDAE